MPKVAMYNIKGEQVGEVELNDAVFGVAVRRTLLHDVVVAQLANRRRGTHDTKTMGDVRGGGRKPWRQKGTGRSRHGSIRSPLWKGGGVIFGPHPRNYGVSLPRKIRRLALKSALSSKVEAGKIMVLDELSFEQPKTKDMINVLDNLKIEGKALVVTAGKDENVFKSARNIPGIKPVIAECVSVYDLLVYPILVITRDAIAKVEEVLAS